MRKTFFEELNTDNTSGVAYKNVNLKKFILSYLANSGSATIAELCKELYLSAPKINTLLNDLISDGLVQDFGKVDSSSGRKPNLYGLVSDSGFFLGVDVKQTYINIGLSDFQKKLVYVSYKIPYTLTNDKGSLEALCALINDCIKELPCTKDKILGIGVNLSGRINYATGYSYSFFHFDEEPLSKIIENHIGIRVFLENDSRAMAYGEFCSGVIKDEKNVLFLNIDYGLGMGIMINSQLYYGKSGYAGEVGHMPFFNNEIICHCGKKGCLETEASGRALVRIFKEELAKGSSTVIKKKLEDIILDDIIEAAINDDVLAIELIARIGEKLGRGIASLINVFNPELLILGGRLSTTEEYIRLPIKSALNKYSLSLVINDTQLKMSKLGVDAGIVGACLLVRNRVLSLN
ncbi:ROK family transcriptional regulator [Mucilaginibacter sp.]|uniref:ROK family transcriptional regulator n=1 Tax=Mucilaginibacter sp. TaxID=1882438 RepID=UPI003AFFA545